MNRRTTASAALLALLLAAATAPAQAPPYDPPPRPGDLEETNNPPMSFGAPDPPRPKAAGTYKPVVRRNIPPVPGDPPPGVSRPGTAPAKAASPAPAEPVKPAERPDRFMRPWPDGKLEGRDTDPAKLKARVEALLAEDEFRRAERALKLLDRMTPDDPWTLFQLGRVLSHTGRFGEAGLLFSRARARGHSAAETGQAILWNLLAEFVRAKDDALFEKAKGRLLRELAAGKTVKPAPPTAGGTAETGLAAEPGKAAPAELGTPPYPFPHDREALLKAVKAGRICLIPERDTPRARRLLDEAAAAATPADAVAPLQALLERIPDHYDALLALGDALRKTGKGDEAKREYLNALFVRPLDPRPFAGLAELALAAGNLEAAKDLVRRGLAIDATLPALGELVERILAAEREAAAARARPAAKSARKREAPLGIHGFVPEQAIAKGGDDAPVFASDTEILSGNRGDAPPVARAAAGDRVRILSRVGRFLHVELVK